MSGYDPSKPKPGLGLPGYNSKPGPRQPGYNPLLSASLQVDDFAARLMPAAPPPPAPVISEVKQSPVVYGTMTTTELGLAGTSSPAALVREETFSDISLAPSAMPSPFPGSSSSTDAAVMQMNPLEDLDAFGQGGGGLSQGHDGGYTAMGSGGGAGGNTATEMLINQASSITANFQQALPAVASTVFSHFSNYLKGGQPPHSSHAQPQQQMHPTGGGIDVGVSQYVSPLDDIYHQQMSNPTESVNQMPLFISPQDAQGTISQSVQRPPMPAIGAGNTYRIGGQKKKAYAPPPVQGFTSQAPVNFTPGYDPTMPIQSGTAAGMPPPLPPMVGEIVPATLSPPPRPSSVPQQTQQMATEGTSPAAPYLQPTTVMPSTASMFMPPLPPAMVEPPIQPQSFFQTPPTPSQLSQRPAETEKSKSFISSFFNPNTILDRLQGRSPQPMYDNVQQQSGGAGGAGYGDFGVIATGQASTQPPMAFQPQIFNQNPIQAPPPHSVADHNAVPGAMGLFNTPPPPQSAMPSSSVPPISVFNQPPPSSTTPAMTMIMSPPSAAATPELPPMAMAMPMQEPPRAVGGVGGGGYRMNKSSRLAYANPNLIAQSSTTSGFMAATNPGQVPPPTQWFNPGENASVASVPDVGGGVAVPQQLATNLFAPSVDVAEQVHQEVTPIQNIPPAAVQEQSEMAQSFLNPVGHKEEVVELAQSVGQVNLITPPPPTTMLFTPDLIVPPSTATPPIVANVVSPVVVPSSAFFDNAFSQNNNTTAPPLTVGPSSDPQQPQTATHFQPVNFFNAFNNPTTPPVVNETTVCPPPQPSSIAAMAFEPTTRTTITTGQEGMATDNHQANISATPAVISSVDGGAGEISAILPTTTDSSLLDEVSTRAVWDEQSQQMHADDLLCSFERSDDINSKFFDSPPEVQPTDPIANPNFFKSFMKAKFSANNIKFGEEEDQNDQSVVVEPPSHGDDSSVSCASFPSLDQSSAAQVTGLNLIGEAGFQIHQNVETMSSRMSTSPSMPLPTDMDGVPTMTRSRTGSMSSQVSNGSRAAAAATGPYRPVYKHWFYSYKDGSEKIKWAPMTMRDSLAVETAFTDPGYDTSKLIATDGGRHDVDIGGRRRVAVYWQAEVNEVRRCSWFYKTIDCSFVPFEEEMAEVLEQEYKDAHESKQWQRKITLGNGEIVQMHDANLMMHYISTSVEGTWGATSSQTTMKRVVKRGVDEFNIEDGEPDKIDHVLFMVHGIGAACDLKFRSVEEVVDEFRSIAHQMVQSHYRGSYDSGEIGRIEVLPISWHSELHSEESGIDAKLKAITLESIPKIRSLANETILDVLFYTSPKFCQHIIDIVAGSLNKLYTLFCQRNPAFAGRISLSGHSLGSLILFDLLTHQKAEPENRENVTSATAQELGGAGGSRSVVATEPHVVPTNYMIGHEGTTGQPCISYPQLLFTAANFFALGSPIGMFVTVRGIDTLGLDFKLPTCDRFFNIFHPFDPVAYRIESLVNGECAALQPVLIPHHKGRKRMHLELRETMERVKGDLKARIINTFKSTMDTVTQFKAFSRTDTVGIASEVDKVLDEQLQMNGGQSAGGGESTQATNSEVDPGETDLSLGRLNQGQRIDYVLQEAPLEFFNGYLFALTSHVCYWESEDTTLFVVKEIYSSMGVRTDSKIPQHSMTIERPTN